MSTSSLHRQRRAVAAVLPLSCCLRISGVVGFAPRTSSILSSSSSSSSSSSMLFIRPPPGWGYAGVEDEENLLPDTYEPMMEYPGTMRPGKTPENMPFQDLPIGDDDPDPVPWPHFQEIEWHHQWEPPHEAAMPMELFIESHGRWATPEMEAAIRAGARKNVRERQDAAASSQAAANQEMVITDDEEDDEDEDTSEVGDIQDDPIPLGGGVFGKLGSDADRLQTAAAVDPAQIAAKAANGDDDEDVTDQADEDALDDFLLDLGLDLDDDENENDNDGGSGSAAASDPDDDDILAASSEPDELPPSLELGITGDAAASDDDDDDAVGTTTASTTTATINVDDDDAVAFLGDEADDDDLESGVDTVPLEDFGDEESALDTEDVFDEGGFDYDDGGDYGDGGDSW